MMPGPSVAESGAPVPLTGSPTSRPVVFSYTWMVVRASLTLMTSPMRPAFPTYTISAMPNVLVSFTVTTGPVDRINYIFHRLAPNSRPSGKNA